MFGRPAKFLLTSVIYYGIELLWNWVNFVPWLGEIFTLVPQEMSKLVLFFLIPFYYIKSRWGSQLVPTMNSLGKTNQFIWNIIAGNEIYKHVNQFTKFIGQR
jgi:hypothetical protein